MDMTVSSSFLYINVLFLVGTGIVLFGKQKSILLLLATMWLVSGGAVADEQQQNWDALIKQTKDPEVRLQLALEAGIWYFDQDKPTRAKRYFERAVEQGKLVGDHLALADALFRLAGLQDNKMAARAMLDRSLDIYERLKGSLDVRIAPILESLVWTYAYRGGDFDIAVGLLKRAVNIRKSAVIQTGLPETLRTLAWLYESNGYLTLAETYYVDALEIERNLLDPDDIRIILSMENLVLFYFDLQDYDKAEKLLLNKRKLHRASQAKDYYNLGRTESMLARIKIRQGDMRSAERYLLSGLGHVQRGLGQKDAPAVLPALLELVDFYATQQRFERAKMYFDQAQSILTNEGDGTLESHARMIEDDVLAGNDGSYSWSVAAQIDGIRKMLVYAINQ